MSYDPIHDTFDARPSVSARSDTLAVPNLLQESAQPVSAVDKPALLLAPDVVPSGVGQVSALIPSLIDEKVVVRPVPAEEVSSPVASSVESPVSSQISSHISSQISSKVDGNSALRLVPDVAPDYGPDQVPDQAKSPVPHHIPHHIPDQTPDSSTAIPPLISDAECMALHEKSPARSKLKKLDGEPLQRIDIQYDFLHALFTDETRAFSNPRDRSDKISFAHLYINTIAESPKCSKILRERFYNDRKMALAVAKVCLLVNVGRLNTTINFVPDYKLTVRTFHSIPSLQYEFGSEKIVQLQDTPRVKTILKATCENPLQCTSLDDFAGPAAAAKRAHTSITQLLFLFTNGLSSIGVASTTSATITQLFSNSSLDPAARAKCLLWIVYLYLETDLVDRTSNPFGGPSMPPCPEMDQDQRALTDIDTPSETAFAQVMNDSRQKFLADEPLLAALKRAVKPKKADAAAAASSSPNGKDAASATASPGPAPFNESPGPATATDAAHPHACASTPLSSSPVRAHPHAHHGDPLMQGSPKRRRVASAESFMVSIPTSTTTSTKPIEAVNDYPRAQTDPAAQAAFDEGYVQAATVATAGPRLSVAFSTPANLSTPEVAPEWLVLNQQEMLEKSNPVIQQVRTLSKASIASFNKKTIIFGHWLYRYFKYKRSIGNRLAGMAWEDIRLDVLLGAEPHCYREFGQSLLDPAKEFHVRPVHHLDEANERSAFTLQLMSYCNEYARDKVLREMALHFAHAKSQDNVSLDLDSQSVSFL